MLYEVITAQDRVPPALLAGLAAAAAGILAALAGGDGQHAHLLLAGVSGHPVHAPPVTPVGDQRAFIEINQDHLGLLLAVLLLAGWGTAPRRSATDQEGNARASAGSSRREGPARA